MKHGWSIISGILAIMLLAACQKDEVWKDDPLSPNDGVLRFEGVNAQQVQVSTRSAAAKGYFKENSHYRIWAWANESGQDDRTLRFNACGIETVKGSTHSITFPEFEDNKADLTFKNEQDVIDFYGLIDPSQQKEQDVEDPEYQKYVKEYLQADETYSVSLQSDTLPDLRYAARLGCTKENSPYIIPLEFKHILTKLSFEIIQEVGDDPSEGKYGELFLEDISVLNQAQEGTFGIKEGKFGALSAENRTPFPARMNGSPLSSIPIGVTPKKAGSVLVFPMLTKPEPGNLLQVTVTLGSKDKSLLEPFTSDDSEIRETDEGSKFLLDITCPVYANPDYTEGTTGDRQPLYLQPNFEYVLQFMIISNDVRIITIVPRVYEWLDGEPGGREDQDLGQPPTFNGVTWSDRNLGATSANPLANLEEWMKSVGYFYQFDRNIPYFPNTYDPITKRVDLKTPLDIALSEIPDNTKKRSLYPVVNYEAWGVPYPEVEYLQPQGSCNPRVIEIGELPSGSNPYWSLAYNMNNAGKENLWTTPATQPCPKGWRIPTQEDFLGIIPGGPYAGNITFRIFKGKDSSGGWQSGDTRAKEPDLPYHFRSGDGLGITTVVTDPNLQNGLTPMLTPEDKPVTYFGGYPCLYREEKDDPQPGAKSCYVLSLSGEDWNRVVDGSGKLKPEQPDFVFNWGVIYGIKNVGTPQAYRVKWEIRLVGEGTEVPISENAKTKYCLKNPTTQYDNLKATSYNGIYGVLVISRYPSTAQEHFNPDENGSYEWVAKKTEWWSQPAEVLYLPICGAAGNWCKGGLFNIGSEAWYATSVTGASSIQKHIVWLKMVGWDAANQGVNYNLLSPKKDLVSIRCVRDY